MASSPNSPHNVFKNRNVVLKLKNQSPEFRDVHRERCRVRLRESRDKFLRRFRMSASQEDVKQIMYNTMQEEYARLTIPNLDSTNDLIEESLRTLKEMEVEAHSEEEAWILQEYDAILAEEDALINAMMESGFTHEVVCPICQKGKLYCSSSNNTILCGFCDIKLPGRSSIEKLDELIFANVETHSNMCMHKPLFSLTPEEDNVNLLMMCPSCSYLNIIL